MAQQKTQVSKSGIDFFYDTNSKLRLLSDAGRLYSISGSTVSEGNKLVIYSDLASSSVNTAKYAEGLGTSTANYTYSGLVSALNSKLNKDLMPEATAGNKGYYITTDGTKYIWKDLSLSVMDLPRPFINGYLLSSDGTNLKWNAPYSLPTATSDLLGGIKVGTGLNILNSILSVKYGDSEGTSCQGNDIRLSDSRPASDVYPWAKASEKPEYKFTEVGIPEVTDQSGKILSNNGTTLSWIDEYSYTLPTATSEVLGGIKVGTGLGIKNSVLSVSYGTTSTTACVGNDSRLSDTRICPNGLSISTNGTSKLSNWDGSSIESIDIGYSDVGAAAASHPHGNLTNDGKIGTDADRFIVTTTGGALTSSGSSLYISGNNIYSTGFYITSSRSKKHDIKNSDINALDIIDSINVVEFKYNDDPDDKLRIGLIAEDSPELVVTDKSDAMDSGNVLGLLLKAVQELNSKLYLRNQ